VDRAGGPGRPAGRRHGPLADAAYRETEFKAGSIIVDYADPAAFRQYLATEQTRLQPVLAQIKAE